MAKSIKLGSDTYLDYSGVTTDSSGTTLKSRIDDISYGHLSLNCDNVGSEADLNALMPGTRVLRASSAFNIGGISVPGYTRFLKINYNSQEGAVIGITPEAKLIVLFRAAGVWIGRILS